MSEVHEYRCDQCGKSVPMKVFNTSEGDDYRELMVMPLPKDWQVLRFPTKNPHAVAGTLDAVHLCSMNCVAAYALGQGADDPRQPLDSCDDWNVCNLSSCSLPKDHRGPHKGIGPYGASYIWRDRPTKKEPRWYCALESGHMGDHCPAGSLKGTCSWTCN